LVNFIYWRYFHSIYTTEFEHTFWKSRKKEKKKRWKKAIKMHIKFYTCLCTVAIYLHIIGTSFFYTFSKDKARSPKWKK
jgi:hypothetical protein